MSYVVFADVEVEVGDDLFDICVESCDVLEGEISLSSEARWYDDDRADWLRVPLDYIIDHTADFHGVRRVDAVAMVETWCINYISEQLDDSFHDEQMSRMEDT